MSNPNTIQPPTSGNDDFQFVSNARDMFITWHDTNGLGYNITVALIPGQPAYPGQSDIIPGWMHALITQLIAFEHRNNLFPFPNFVVNPDLIQVILFNRYQLIVPREVIVALIFEFLRYPADLQNSWFVVTVHVPSMFMIDDRWRAVQRDQFNPANPEDVRRDMVRAAQVTLAPSDQPSVSPIPLRIPPRPQSVVPAPPVYRLDSPVFPPSPARQQRSAGPSPSPPQNPPQSPPPNESQEDPSDNADSFTRRPGGRLRRITRRISYALTTSRRRSRTNNAAAPLNLPSSRNQNNDATRASSRSASPPTSNTQPAVRQRTPRPLQRSSTVTGATNLTRRISNSLRNVGGSLRRNRRDGSGGDDGNDNNSPNLNLSNTLARNNQFVISDVDRSIEDILSDTGLNSAPRNTLPPRNTVFQDGNYRLQGPPPNAHSFPTSPTPLNFDGYSDDDDDLYLNRQPAAAVARSGAVRVTGPRAQAPRPVPVQFLQNQIPNPPTRPATANPLSSLQRNDGSGNSGNNNATQPQPAVGSHGAPVPLPPLQWNPNQPSAPPLPPPYAALPTAHHLPGTPYTLGPDATTAQVNYFMSIWRPGQHVPDVIPGHAFTCTVPGCNGRNTTKRGMKVHYQNLHGMSADQVPDLNQRLPVPARSTRGPKRIGKVVLVDANGNDLPGRTNRRSSKTGGGGGGDDDDDEEDGGDDDEAA